MMMPNTGVGKGQKLRIATLNVSTLAGRISAITELFMNLELDILVLQETKLDAAGVGTAELTFRLSGLEFFGSLPAFDSGGSVTAGTGIVSNINTVRDSDPKEIAPGRFVGLKWERKSKRPIRLGGLYAQASDPAKGSGCLSRSEITTGTLVISTLS